MRGQLILIAVMLCAAVLLSCEVPQGDTGPIGPQGSSGPSGTEGQDGQDGQDGTDGAIGTIGPQGPPGPQGPKGDPGEPGACSLKRYEPDFVVPSATWNMVAPEIKLDNLPMLNVYVEYPDMPDRWFPLPFKRSSDVYEDYYVLFEGQIRFLNCNDLKVKVIILQ